MSEAKKKNFTKGKLRKINSFFNYIGMKNKLI